MTQDEIIKLAKAYGFTGGFDADGKLLHDEAFVVAVTEAVDRERAWWEVQIKTDIETVKKEEREACAKVCEEMRDAWVNRPVPLLGYAVELDGAAIAIRARGTEA